MTKLLFESYIMFQNYKLNLGSQEIEEDSRLEIPPELRTKEKS